MCFQWNFATEIHSISAGQIDTSVNIESASTRLMIENGA